MTRARATLVNVEDTPYYHCYGRCVRRAYLCGVDVNTGASFEHRRAWISKRLSLLVDVFAVHLCAYALMSNHYHLVVKVDPAVIQELSDQDIVERWTQLFKGPAVFYQDRHHLLSVLSAVLSGQASFAITSFYQDRHHLPSS